MIYIYLHSENYQSIEKLLSGCAGGGCSLQLKEQELAQDLRVLGGALGKAAFEPPAAPVEKSTSSKQEAGDRRNPKKFAKKAVKT